MANQQATISFVPPVDNGGSPIIDYTATSTPGSITATGNASPIIVAGLTNGTSYTFTVRARNLIGSGSESSLSNSVIPSSPVTSTFSPTVKSTELSLSNGNLTATSSPAQTLKSIKTTATFQTTGKYYCEMTLAQLSGGGNMVGIGNSSMAVQDAYPGQDGNGYAYLLSLIHI